MENAIDTSCHDVTKNKWHELWPCTRIAELLDTAATAPPPCVSSQTRVTRSSVFDRLSMLDFACFMDLNIANWVKSTRASDPDAGSTGLNRAGKRSSNYSEAIVLGGRFFEYPYEYRISRKLQRTLCLLWLSM